MSSQGLDPRSGRSVGEPVADTSIAELDRLAEAASAAFPQWAATSREQRARVLEGVADALDAEAPVLAAIADGETALGLPRLQGEVQRTSGQLHLFARVIRDGAYLEAILDSPDAAAVPPRPDLRRMLRPLGPVAVFGASNFPFAFSIAGGDTASALAAGCPVLAKAHPAQPGTAKATFDVVAAALKRAGAPEGVFAVVYGTQAGLDLVRHPAIKAVGFTGSTRGGRHLFDLAQDRPEPIPFYGELGSLNPVVVLPDAAATRAAAIAQGYAASLTLGVGQFCTNPGLLFAPQALLPSLGEAIAATRGGPMLTAGMRDAYESGMGEMARHAARLGQGQADAARNEVAPRLFHVDVRRFLQSPQHYLDEHFGPAGLVVVYDDIAELTAAIDLLPGALTASVHAEPEDEARAAQMLSALASRAGRLVYNAWPTGVAVSWSMQHGGPWPATTNPLHTSVGATSIRRWLAPVCYQDWPEALLPPELHADNPMRIPRRVDGRLRLGTQA